MPATPPAPTEPMTAQRLAKIRRSHNEITDYVNDGLIDYKPEYGDRGDLLAEVDRLGATLARVANMADAFELVAVDIGSYDPQGAAAVRAAATNLRRALEGGTP